MAENNEALEDTPHATGWCVCRVCSYEWVGVWPIPHENVKAFECPNCGHMTGQPQDVD
jgi:predicted RNA-binding Zn-ribbon protein involved in translation (DUF1610 family)